MKSDYKESRHIQIIKFFLLTSCIYGTTDYCIPKEISDYCKSLYGSKYIYLTNICLYLTVLCLIMGILVKNYKIIHIKDIYKHSASVLLPLNGLVTILFWVLYSIDPTLLRDKEFYDRNIRISLFTDMCVHLFPFLSLILEVRGIILKRQKRHLIFYVAFALTYYCLCLYYSTLNKFWVYPILGKLTTINRVALFGASSLITIGIYEITMLYIVK